MLFIFMLLPVLTSGNEGCFTWQLSTKKSLVLNISGTYRFLASDALFLIDNQSNKVATCQNDYCSLTSNTDTYVYYPERNQYGFTIERYQAIDFDGMWSVFRGDKEYLKAEISHMKGTMDNTHVNLEARVFGEKENNISFVYLKCWSCRESYGQFAEFLINNISQDSLRFDPISNICYHSCFVCDCSKTKNSFEIVYKYTETMGLFSCQMIFTDDLIGSRFNKTASVYVNSTGVFTLPTTTDVIKSRSKISTGVYTLPTTRALIKPPSRISTGVSSLSTTTFEINNPVKMCTEPTSPCKCPKIKETTTDCIKLEDHNRQMKLLYAAFIYYLYACFFVSVWFYCKKPSLVQIHRLIDKIQKCLPCTKKKHPSHVCFWILSVEYLVLVFIVVGNGNWQQCEVLIVACSFVFGCATSFVFMPGYLQNKLSQNQDDSEHNVTTEMGALLQEVVMETEV